MKRFINIVLGLLLMLPMTAQNANFIQTTAGKDFYFTLLDHWGWSGYSAAQPIKHVGISITAVEAADITFSTPLSNGGGASPSYTRHMDAGSSLLSSFAYPDQLVLQGVTIHSTGNIYVDIWVHGGTASDQSVILPKHLLGKHYMLQGIPGDRIATSSDPDPYLMPTYSQFTVVGTENETNVTITPRVDIVSRSRGNVTISSAGQQYTTSIQENEVLLFQTLNYRHDISGTVVESDKAVAVFQGNNLTRFPADVNWADYTWEQARPTDAWGKEFIVAGTGRLVEKAFAITALEDNTQVEFYIYSMRYKTVTLNSGETAWGGENISGYGGLVTEYIKSDKPVCCYMYTTGCTQNNDKGDPSMAEILPVDHMATEAHWGLMQTDDNSPFSNTLLVTTRDDNTDKVQFNGRLLSEYATQSGVETYSIYGYTTYEIPHSVFGNLTTLGEGFSAYVVRVGKTAEAAAFNVTLPDPPPEELCTDGVLLFREDFGGNDVNDPVVSHTPVEGMSYTQIYALEPGPTGSMGAGRYLVSKEGYRNSTYSNYSVWHIMDDHTYPDDKTRGYMMEVDGKGGQAAFYRTTLTGLCAGSRMSFSANIANLTTAVQYNGWRNDRGYVHPKLLFVIRDIQTGEIIAQQGTDTISHDWNNYPKPWSESAEWQLVGMNFTIPDGTDDIELSIYNNANGEAAGNDFALDDIEIRLCAPAVEIAAPDSVCIDTKVSLRAEMENDGTFKEPLQYKWYFSADSLNWEPVNDGNGQELRLKAKPKHSGWYRVAVAGSEGIENENCRSMSEPFKLYVIEDCPPILCPEGVLLKHEDLGGTATSYSTAIDGLCENMDLSLIINLPSGHAPCRLMLRLTDSGSGNELRAYDTGDIPSDSLQVGTTFTVPEGVQGVQWSISQNGGNGDFPIENTEVRLCMEPIRIASNNSACRKKPHTLHAIYENYGTLESPKFRWEFSPDSMVWTELQTGASKMYTIPVVHRSHEGWYRVTVADADNMDMPNCRETSDPFKLATQYCNTAVDQYMDTTACDTLLYYDLTWRGHVWPAAGTVVDTLRDIDIDDSVYVYKTLQTTICCPDIRTFRVDSAVCDTLLPFLWFYQDTMLLFGDIGEQEIEYPHWRWENCIGEVHTLALDTFHCERLYPIIVNKYNWQLVCNNMELARLFPDMHPLEFQWFKDSVAIEGANADDYSEENELHGVFQLRIKLDRTVDNHDEYIWSNILDIHDTPAPAPIIKRVYNSQGIPVSEEQTGSGVYLIHYQQGDRVWTEKKVQP